MKIKYLLTAFIFTFASFFLFQKIVNAAPDDKVTICHANGNGTFIRIVTSENAIGAHFDNPGTPKQGHEDDVLLQGDVPCPGVELSPTPTNSITPTVTPTLTVSPTPTTSLTPTPTVAVSLTPTTKPSKTPTPTKVKPSKSPSPTKKPKPSITPYPDQAGGNVCNITNLISVNQNTGGNNANQNTGGTVSIISGDANAVLNVNNACGSNYVALGLGGLPSTNINISDNGAGSLNSVLIKNNSTLIISQ